jgi:hypothetical protein
VPPLADILYDIAIVVAVMLGVAMAATVAFGK